MAMHKKIKVKPDGSVEFQHFDSGGTVVGYNANPLTDISNALTTQNQYQATAPDISQQNSNYEGANAGQTSLEQALTNQANGAGPNPAQAQFQQNTNANAQQAAGLVASQRGLNPGEAARIGSQASVNANQQAAGQSATQQAQQELNAEGQLNNVYSSQEGAANSNASVNNQGQLGAQDINAQISQNNTNSVNQTEGGIENSISGANILSALAKGGIVGKDGKKVENPKLSNVSKSDRFKGNLMPSHMKAVADIYHAQHFDTGGIASIPSAPDLNNSNATAARPGFQSGDSSSDDNSSDDNSNDAKSGSSVASLAALLSKGGNVPGKPKVGHDAYKNDTVDAKLTPGEVVIDLDTMKSKGPIGDAARMLAKHIESKNGDAGSNEDDFKEALKRAVAGRKSK